MADTRSKYLGKQYGQVKVPVVKAKEKEVQNNFYKEFKENVFKPYNTGKQLHQRIFGVKLKGVK